MSTRDNLDLSEFTDDDKIIVVVGPPGGGKSTFIAQASRLAQESICHDLENPNSDLQIFRADDMIGGHPVVFLDAPGFEDGIRSHEEIFELVTELLLHIYKHKVGLAGIIYVHPITAKRMDGTQMRSLRAFKKICEGDMSGVTIISSKWGEMNNDSVGEKREEELKRSYWKEWTDSGCHIERFRDSYQSAYDIVRGIVNVPLALHLPRGPVHEEKMPQEIKETWATRKGEQAARIVHALGKFTNSRRSTKQISATTL